MRGTQWLVSMVVWVAGCACPPGEVLPDARMVGLMGAGRTVEVEQGILALHALAFLGEGRLVAATDARYEDEAETSPGLVWLDAASDRWRNLALADGTPDALRRTRALAPARDAGIWLARPNMIAHLSPEGEVVKVVGTSASPSVPGDAAPAPSPARSRAVGLDGYGVGALADDGRGGVFASITKDLWWLAQEGSPRKLATFDRPIRGLAPWGDGVIVLADSGFNYFDEWEEPEDADEDAVAREDEHREAEPTIEAVARVETRGDAVWYVVPDRAPRPWEHGRRVTNPMALSGVPGGPVIFAEAGPLDDLHGESNPYATAIVRFQADGSRHSLIASEPDMGPSSGFKLLMWCPTPSQPAPWWIANLTIGRGGNVAFTSLPDRLILWNP